MAYQANQPVNLDLNTKVVKLPLPNVVVYTGGPRPTTGQQWPRPIK